MDLPLPILILISGTIGLLMGRMYNRRTREMTLRGRVEESTLDSQDSDSDFHAEAESADGSLSSSDIPKDSLSVSADAHSKGIPGLLRGKNRRATGDSAARLGEIMARDPRSSQALNRLGTFHAGQGHSRRAERSFREAESLDPMDARPLINRAQMAIAAGRTDEARRLLERATSLGDNAELQQFAAEELRSLDGAKGHESDA